MGTVFIEKRDSMLKIEGNTIVFYENQQRTGTIPIIPLDRVIIIGNCTIETSVIKKLIENGCTIVFLSGKNMKYIGKIYGGGQNDANRRLLQCKKHISDFAIRFCCEIIIKKLKGYINNLKVLIEKNNYSENYFTKNIGTIFTCLKNLTAFPSDRDTISGLEGAATANYFEAYKTFFDKELNFENRNRRPPRDPVNSLLSLFYTTLHYELVREIEISGLDPFIGYLHSIESSRESLACDFSEIFRPSVDIKVYEIFASKIFNKDDFYISDNGGCYILKKRKREIYEIIENFHSNLRQSYRTEIMNFIRNLEK